MLRVDLASAVEAFLAADARLAVSACPDDVHDARVALRRIRSHLRTFRSLFEPAFLRRVRPDVTWADSALAAVRDLDVTASRLLAGHDHASARDMALLTTLIAKERSEQLRGLAAARASERFDAAHAALDELATSPVLRGRATRDAARALPPLLMRPWHELDASVRAARRSPNDETLHAVRIRTKELRYGSALASAVLGDPATRLAEACARLQGHLGREHDAAAAARWITERSTLCSDASGLCTELARRERRAADELAATWQKKLKRVDRSWRQLRRASRS